MADEAFFLPSLPLLMLISRTNCLKELGNYMKPANSLQSSIFIFTILTMGTTSSSSSLLKLGSRSTASEVASFYSNGQADGFLKGKVAVITGGNSGIGLEVMMLITKT
jgi:uncharacterized membrane protein